MSYQWQSCYSYLLLPCLRFFVRLSALTNAKNRASLAGRQGLWQRINQQMEHRVQNKPLIWFHVASAGEYLQALPFMNKFIDQHYQCVLTVTSVTGLTWATKQQAASEHIMWIDYLPFDTKRNMHRLVRLLNPAAIIYVKFDLWPNMIWEAHKHQIPQFLISATLHPQSKRLSHGLSRSLYRSVYQCLNGIYAVSAGDKQRFLQTAPNHSDVYHIGDTRFDSVVERKKSIQAPQLPDYVKQNPVIVLGSSWPEDEKHVFPALLKALDAFPHTIAIIVPHEINEHHLHATEQCFATYGTIRYSAITTHDKSQPRIIIVDTVGHLSSLYVYANIAYVGGAFGKGVHNVMEPCVMGVTTIFGPFYTNSPEVVELVNNQQCFPINNQQDIEQRLFEFLTDPTHCSAVGKTAAAYIEQRAGASETCYQLIEEKLHV